MLALSQAIPWWASKTKSKRAKISLVLNFTMSNLEGDLDAIAEMVDKLLPFYHAPDVISQVL